jgi:predicted TIM-barrel fold metal-dependent hydrolase
MNIPLDELLQQMETAGVNRAVLHAEYEFGDYTFWNRRTYEVAKRYPEKFIPFASVDPRDRMTAVRELNKCLGDWGFKGLNFQPGFLKLLPTDRCCYPLYTKCIEYNVPVALHSGINFSLDGPIKYGHPLELDEVACDFPELRIIANHGGWPWATESVAIAWKHPNIFLEFGAISPKYIAQKGGWDPMFQFINSILQDQVVYGTDWPMISFDRTLKEWRDLPLKPEVKEKLFYKNTLKLIT